MATDDISTALAHGEFYLVYQPTLDLESGAFAGVEALLRRRPATGTEQEPADFISQLEESGDIVPVGRWTLNTACEDGASWHDKGYRFSVSVNVSARQLRDPQLAESVIGALEAAHFDPTLLVLEFPLGAFAKEGPGQLDVARSLGVRFAIDDFDPRLSSFATLKDLGVDVIKVDRSFTASLSTGEDGASLIQALVQQSEAHHVQVIAAGIEDTSQRDTFQSERVHVGQGYLFSHPHTASDIDRYLEDFAIFSGKPL